MLNFADLFEFLDESHVNFFAVKTISECLEKNGFRRIEPTQPMPALKPGDQFYVTKNDSSLYAFRIGERPLAESGFHLICAHCDSPTFRIKPNAEIRCEGGLVKLNTEVYGGPILSTWMDRALSLAGRVIIKGKDALHPETRLVDFKRSLLTIPNLAIHFNRQVNDGVKLSKQKDMQPIIGIINEQFEGGVLMNLIAETLQVEASDILDFDLYLYENAKACAIGTNDEFISSGRLDDLSMVHAGMTAMLQANRQPGTTKVLAIFDNEETGSQTKQGAGSPFLASMLQRIALAQGGTLDDYYRAVEQAFMVSADNAHAWHPNYSEKYDPTNHPKMGGGPVIKINAAQKYATDAQSAAVFAEICRKADVPCQYFVNHSDVAGGSTLGNILTGSLPIRGVDMGNPIWAMHSCRETGSIADHDYCIRTFTEFYNL